MRRAVSILIALTGVAFATDASARPKFSFGSKAAAPAVAAPAQAGRTLIVVPGRGLLRSRSNDSTDKGATTTSPLVVPAALATPAAAAPALAGRGDPKETPEAFRARCGAAQGSVVGATTHGFCIIN